MSLPRKVWGFALPAIAFLLAIVGLVLDSGAADLAPFLLMSAVIVTIAFLIWLLCSLFASGSRVLFGDHIVARILGFGVALVFFPAMITAPFQAVARIVRLLSQSLPLLLHSWRQLSTDDPGALAVLLKVIDGAMDAAQLPLTTIIFGFITWVIAGHVISAGLLREDVRIRAYAALRDFSESSSTAVRRIPSSFWSTMTLIATLVAGMYLMLAAIAVIPYLRQEAIPVEAVKTQLTQALDVIQPTQAAFDIQHPAKLVDADPFAGLKQALGLPTSPLPAADQPATPNASATNAGPATSPPAAIANSSASRDTSSLASEAERQVAQLDAIRSTVRSQWERVRADAWRAQAQLRRELETQFEIAVITMRGTSERVSYVTVVREFYAAQISRLNENLDVCRDTIQRTDLVLGQSSNIVVQGLKSDGTDEDKTLFARTLAPLGLAISRVSCEPYARAAAPGPPARGLGWGPLGTVFKWLLSTDSLDVVVIIGMLGAGLFGSAVGTFIVARVRHGTTGRARAESLVWHLVRGFAATVVVYLALKTGVGFAAAGNPDPDPYLMLFLCFIGTVYSDDVWNWAKRTGRSYWTAGNDEGGAAAAHRRDHSGSSQVPSGSDQNPPAGQ